MKHPSDPSDRLIDALLREQSRDEADAALLEAVEAKLHATPQRNLSARRLASLAAAAAVVASAGMAVLWNSKEPSGLVHSKPPERSAEDESRRLPAKTPVPASARPKPSRPPAAEAVAAPAIAATDLAALDLAPAEPIARPAILPVPSRTTRQRIVPPPAGPVPDESGGFVFPGEEETAADPPPTDRDQYARLVDPPWQSPLREPLSTFSIDVDTASYTNLRRLVSEDRPVPPDAVRIEECINYFDYNYPLPEGDLPIAAHGRVTTCPWQPRHLLARIALQGREVKPINRPASNLVFLIDVSGSMQDTTKLPLLKRSMRVLIDELDERDRVGIVVYAGSEGVVLPPTTLDGSGRDQLLAALEKAEAGGSTNGGAGLERAYRMASENHIPGGVNRVILATDGDFNVGTTGDGELVALVKRGSQEGVHLSVLGFGRGNLNDGMLEAITNEGDGNYFYIDSDREARRVFLQKLTGTLVTIASDVKIQVEFNPGKVAAYRLIGYANRVLRAEDFADDRVDAGDIGAGHSVTAFYEIVPVGVEPPDLGGVDPLRYQRSGAGENVPSDDWFTLKLRHKRPGSDHSELTELRLAGEPMPWEKADDDFRFAAAVALFGMKLRGFPESAEVSWNRIEKMAAAAVGDDPGGHRAEFLGLMRRLGR